MDENNKAKYYEVLGLSEDADQDSVKRAYSVLLKKHKDDKDKLNELEDAYNQVLGFYVVDEEEELKASSNRGKFENFWYHNKLPVLVLIVTAFALVVLVVNSFRNEPTDVNLHFIGDLYCRDINDVYDDVYYNLKDAKAPNVEQLILEGNTPIELEFINNARMKLTSLIASGQLDVIVSDFETFEYMASQGLFMPLKVSKDEDGNFIVEDGRETADLNKKDDAKEYAVYATDNLGDEFLFGLRLEGTEFLDFTNVVGSDLIISMYHVPFNYELAFDLMDLVVNGSSDIEETEEEE